MLLKFLHDLVIKHSLKVKFYWLHIPSIATYILPTTWLRFCLTGCKSPSATLHNDISCKTSEWQDDRGVQTFLCTTHHSLPVLFTLKVHWMIHSVFMTDLGWLLPVTLSGALVSSSSHLIWSPARAAFFGLYHATGNVHIWYVLWFEHIKSHNTEMLFQLFYRIFLLMSHIYLPFPVLAVCLIFYITLSNTLPVFLSINKSFLGSSNRLNQRLCKHPC